ncbi:Planctomycete cytochrome C [Caulifigura coniformis]|uniref:Planctomycete cytochrome C n=1 Tax=Caulifigura coniformis TaxID=2527983 RepID=A0A517SAG0_9PLAN|nr:PSD1 and planctomycete cytochrome C domain-containing protein [Caulifigura coniformis]QDT53103.1 Planctomycete cytochrome C [Caulifigura coniformis]
MRLLKLLTLLVACLIFGTQSTAFAEVDFAHDVLPILKAHCAKCHTNGTYKGSFSLDTKTSLLESKAVEPGKPDDSDLIQRLTSDDPDYRMPPEGDRLKKDDVETLKKWVADGVPWTDGFTFRKEAYKAPLKLKRIRIPRATAATGPHPIDRILYWYGEFNDVTLSPAADDATFLRRVSLDLIGLTPTDEELEVFLFDQRPDKRETLVSSLLERDRDYAAHWITFWNDLLRNDYVGTGYIDGGRRQITKWLISSLRGNKPYDAFVRELIAPSLESEGFANGITWRGRVNASQIRELQFSQNVGQVFLGINLKCASCHDSFIDDWKLDDAYGLAAVVADEPLEIHRCDMPTGRKAAAKFVFPELGTIDPALPRAKRQARLAELLTDPRNGRFSRTIVNRLWRQLMGRGLVEPVDSMASEPWSERVLDHLADHFVTSGYDIKELLRYISTSRAYQSKTVTVEKEPATAEGFVYTGPIARRLTAEQFMDAVWSLTATGPRAPHPSLGARTEFSAVDGKVRAAYVISDPLMRSLGRPNREQVVTTRPELLTTLQALDLSNGPDLAEMLALGAKAISEEKLDRDTLVQRLFRRALSRPPSDEERQLARDLVGESPDEAGIADLIWMIIMLPEFQHVQ